jgi:hypothetical protein
VETADNAIHLVAGKHPDQDEIAKAVAMRMQRQIVLYSCVTTYSDWGSARE